MSDFAFAGRNILLVSPQSWGPLHISKHHYALELARAGAHVFFLDPPEGENGFQLDEVDGIRRIRHPPLAAPPWLRFKARPLFDWLMRRRVAALTRWLRERTACAIDVVWCFDPNTYADLRWFGAPIRIYHPVDPIIYDYQRRPAKSATLLLSVSAKILGSFVHTAPSVPRRVVNHGVHEAMARVARDGLERDDWAPSKARPRIGYVGNLSREAIDRALILKLVDAFPAADFVFWGPRGVSNLGDSKPDAAAFVRTLASRKNVELRGERAPDALARELRDGADAFLLTYRLVDGLSDRSNAHKLLEYLATGKPVVSVRISQYEDRRDLVSMPPDDVDAKLEGLLRDVVTLLQGGASAAAENEERLARRRRREFALANTYASHVAEIERMIQAALS